MHKVKTKNKRLNKKKPSLPTRKSFHVTAFPHTFDAKEKTEDPTWTYRLPKYNDALVEVAATMFTLEYPLND